MRIVPGDELLIKYPGDGGHRQPWSGLGNVVRLTLSKCFLCGFSAHSLTWDVRAGNLLAQCTVYCLGVRTTHPLVDEEVEVEMKTNEGIHPEITFPYTIEFVWKPTSFDRLVRSV